MKPTDDLDDPFLGSAASRGPSFWSRVRWRWRLGLVLCLLTCLTVYIHQSLEARHPSDVPWITGGCAMGMAMLWFGSRVLLAWLEWPSASPFVRGLKGTIRYLGFDASAENRDAAGRHQRDRPPEL
jgi:hypothetical protein